MNTAPYQFTSIQMLFLLLSTVISFLSFGEAQITSTVICNETNHIFNGTAVSLAANYSFPSDDDLLSIKTKGLFDVSLRQWEQVSEFKLLTHSTLRVVTYNILCQKTAENSMYLYEKMSPNFGPLQWLNRWPLMSIELQLLNADVFLLQEVQEDLFYSFIAPRLEQLGYIWRFKKKSSESYFDGCVTAIRSNRLTFANYEPVEYNMGENETMNKPQIGQVSLLFDRYSNQKVVTATTHLLYDEMRGDIKLGQVAVLMAHVTKMLNGSSYPVIIGGDFNLEPFSQIYEFVVKARLSTRNQARSALSGQGCKGGPGVGNVLPKTVGYDSTLRQANSTSPRGSPLNWSHKLSLASVYSHFNGNKREVSTYHSLGAENPDFLFYSVGTKLYTKDNVKIKETDNIQLLRRLVLPVQSVLARTLHEWPNIGTPSDHVPLAADFSLKNI